MEIRKLETEFERQVFLSEYNTRANMNVPKNYILECKVYGAYLDGKLMGGFAFAIGNDMAWPQVLPKANEIFTNVPQKFCLEINLVWAKDELHTSYKDMIRFWIAVTKTATSIENIEYVTFAVDSSRKYLVSLYERIAVGKLYSGEVPKYPGRQASVYYTTPTRLRLVKLICFKEFFIRFRRHLKNSKELPFLRNPNWFPINIFMEP